VSPIFVRPVREQLEHDRLIRHLEGRYRRKFEVAMNPGDQQTAPVKIGAATFFPDLVLSTGKKLAGVVEVESAESVNNLEAMAQWVHFSKARVPFHLYVPMHAYDAAKRLSDANQARPAEIWTYRALPEGFDLVRMFADAGAVRGASSKKPAPKSVAAKSAPPKNAGVPKNGGVKKAPPKAPKKVAKKAPPARKRKSASRKSKKR
jgi:hypothetical protein